MFSWPMHEAISYANDKEIPCKLEFFLFFKFPASTDHMVLLDLTRSSQDSLKIRVYQVSATILSGGNYPSIWAF